MNGTMNRDDWREARREARRQRWDKRRSSWHGGQLTGILFITIGAVYLGSNLGWLPNMDFRSLWPLILVVMGVSDLLRFRQHFPIMGLIMTTVGSVLLMQNLGVLPRDIWRYLWPALLIAWGVTMLFHRAGAVHGRDWGSTNANVLREVVTFGGIRRKVQSQEFEGGSAHATFGGIEIDLREAATKKEEVIIEAYARFGGIEIRVPDSWDVTVNGSGMFGAFEDETRPTSPIQGVTRPRLLVTGEAVFGGVSVKS